MSFYPFIVSLTGECWDGVNGGKWIQTMSPHKFMDHVKTRYRGSKLCYMLELPLVWFIPHNISNIKVSIQYGQNCSEWYSNSYVIFKYEEPYITSCKVDSTTSKDGLNIQFQIEETTMMFAVCHLSIDISVPEFDNPEHDFCKLWNETEDERCATAEHNNKVVRKIDKYKLQPLHKKMEKQYAKKARLESESHTLAREARLESESHTLRHKATIE